ncbi:NnrT protein [Amaricoccus sp.]|uniref:NnrT protein n=1 Tax=Amaricoccus sp. TaxID=1872485 RepID=UPI0026249B64|nr:NnrT protein [Amaricoccus sp.]HRO10388.1 NnrT protein [Amaricoccus sp.]
MAGRPPLRHPGWGLMGLVYPFAAGAVAVNLFFVSLVLSWVGVPVLTPGLSVLGGCLLGVPVTWVFARHIRRLMTEADEAP